MKFKKLKIKDAYTIHTDLKKDNRGYFQRLLCNKISWNVDQNYVLEQNLDFTKCSCFKIL